MSLARPPLPARRSSVAPPPPPRRSSATSVQTPVTNDEVEVDEPIQPMSIAARIASLKLNQVGRSPMSGKPPVRAQPMTPETEDEVEQESPPALPPRRRSTLPKQERELEEQEAPPSLPPRRKTTQEREQEAQEGPPSLPPRRRSSVVPVQQPSQRQPNRQNDDLIRAVSRKPPPIPSAKPSPPPPSTLGRRLPPKPSRLPTPPPEPEPEYEEPLEEGTSDTGCIKCHDFSFVDDHAAQFPKETVSSLDQLAYDLTSPWESETEKFRAIFTWLHHNVAYDCAAFFGGNCQPSSPESTLRSGLAVCDGYATLFLSLAQLAGLQAMKVTGHGKGFGHVATEEGNPIPEYKGNHAWNCGLMDGEWRLFDSCWGSGYIDDSQTYNKHFGPKFFTSTNAEFGKTHYPGDPAYQLISDEDGGPVSWGDYILQTVEGPVLYEDFHAHNFSPNYIQPSTKYIQGGTYVSFNLFKLCEHISTAQADNYVYFICLPNQNRIPLTLNAEGGWSVTVYVPPESGDLSMNYVRTFGERDGKGLGVGEYNAGVGRMGMSFGGLGKWIVV